MKYLRNTLMLKIANSKFAAFLLVMLLNAFAYAEPVKRLAADIQYPVSWCVFPFFLNNDIFLCLLLFGILYIHSDIPFMQYSNMYQIIRTGRKRWVFVQCVGIWIRSFCAVLCVAGFTILSLLPEAEFQNEWGKLLRTVAMSDLSTQYQFGFPVNYEIFVEYTPFQFMALTILVVSLIGAFLGTMMFFLAVFWNRIAAVTAGVFMCILFFFVQNVHPALEARLAKFVPAIWAKVANIATPRMGYYWMPSIPYILSFLAAGIFLLTLLTLWKIKTTELDWVREDV